MTSFHKRFKLFRVKIKLESELQIINQNKMSNKEVYDEFKVTKQQIVFQPIHNAWRELEKSVQCHSTFAGSLFGFSRMYASQSRTVWLTQKKRGAKCQVLTPTMMKDTYFFGITVKRIVTNLTLINAFSLNAFHVPSQNVWIKRKCQEQKDALLFEKACLKVLSRSHDILVHWKGPEPFIFEAPKQTFHHASMPCLFQAKKGVHRCLVALHWVSSSPESNLN